MSIKPSSISKIRMRPASIYFDEGYSQNNGADVLAMDLVSTVDITSAVPQSDGAYVSISVYTLSPLILCWMKNNASVPPQLCWHRLGNMEAVWFQDKVVFHSLVEALTFMLVDTRTHSAGDYEVYYVPGEIMRSATWLCELASTVRRNRATLQKDPDCPKQPGT